jgi:HEAT repeat protein
MKTEMALIPFLVSLILFSPGCTGSSSKDKKKGSTKKGLYYGKTLGQWIDGLNNKEWIVRYKAARYLGVIQDPVVERAVPPLIAALKDEDESVRYAAGEAIGRIGLKGAIHADKAIPALVETLKDKDVSVRVRAAYALRKTGVKAIPALIAALKDESESVRSHAAYALGKIRPRATAAAPALMNALKDKDRYVRFCAAVAMSVIGQGIEGGPPQLMVTALIEAQKSEVELIRNEATYALGAVGPKASKDVTLAAITVLISALRDMRKVAALALAKIGIKAIPALLEALKDKNEQIRSDVAYALGKLSPESRKALPRSALDALNLALKDSHSQVRDNARAALEVIKGQ